MIRHFPELKNASGRYCTIGTIVSQRSQSIPLAGRSENLRKKEWSSGGDALLALASLLLSEATLLFARSLPRTGPAHISNIIQYNA